MNHVVLGYGEVGSAIAELLDTTLVIDPAYGFTVEVPFRDSPACLHVCIPYTARFIDIVQQTAARLEVDLIIVHSTVPVGTTDAIGGAVYSPVRGQHPHLLKALRTFVKFFGGARASFAASFFWNRGVSCSVLPDTRTVEAMKLWETTQLGWFVLLEKEIHKYCEANDVDFDVVYRLANETYNKGYAAMGKPEFTRPILKHMPGPIGGHCVMPNAELLGTWIAEMILAFSETSIESDSVR